MADDKEKIIYEIEIDESDSESGIKSLTVSINSLTEANKKLREERKNVNLATEEGKKRVQEINQILDQNNKIIKENSSALEKQRLNVGNYKDDIVKAANETKFFGVSVNDITGKLTAFANPVTAVAGLVTGLAAAYLSSAAGARDLESAQSSLTSNFKFLSNELAKLVGADGEGGGLLSSLADKFNLTFFGISGLVRGQIAAAAQNTLKEIELLELDAKAVAKRALDQAEVLRRARDDENKSFQARMEAAKQVEGYITVREMVLVNVQKERLGALKLLLAQDQDNLELQKQVKQVQLEISDIQEDSQGKRTEALNGIKVLNAEITKQSEEDLERERQRIALQDEYKNVKIELDETIDLGNSVSRDFIDLKLSEIEVIDESIQANKAYEESVKATVAIDEVRKSSLAGLANSLSGASALGKEFAITGIIASRFAAISQIISNAGIANAKATAASPLTFGQPWVAINTATAGISIASTIANAVQSIGQVSRAAGGGKFLTKGPTMLMVGDNPGGVERITVEPISGKGRTVVGPGLIKMAGGGVLETGQFETRVASTQFANENLLNGVMRAIRNMPRTAVVIEDVNRTQQQQAEILEMATL